ncbi:MAG TPA: response regulator [Gemmatimonadales bacterium]|nr:response regulator [Gemmatimonadales bacterium]
MPDQHLTVLVVDDDPAVRAVATRGLVLAGYDVLQAHDGVHALELLQETDHPPIKLVVVDVVMPGLRGDDLGRLLHHTHPSLPVLYMSGFSAPVLDFLSEREFARRWLIKPFKLEELTAKVHSLLGESHRLVGA